MIPAMMASHTAASATYTTATTTPSTTLTTANNNNTTSSYAPFASSPLNPSRDPSVKTPLRRRRSRLSRKCISVSPSEKLLRQKGAQAYRSHSISRRAAEYETRAIQAIQKKKEMQLRPLGLRNPVVQPKDGDNQPYMFHQMPELGFFTPRKVALAAGMMRAMPSMRDQQETPAQEMAPPPVPELMC